MAAEAAVLGSDDPRHPACPHCGELNILFGVGQIETCLPPMRPGAVAAYVRVKMSFITRYYKSEWKCSYFG